MGAVRHDRLPAAGSLGVVHVGLEDGHRNGAMDTEGVVADGPDTVAHHLVCNGAGIDREVDAGGRTRDQASSKRKSMWTVLSMHSLGL